MMAGESTHGGDSGQSPAVFSPGALRRLVDSCEPVIAAVLAGHLRGRPRGGSVAGADEEDLRAIARGRVLERLQTQDAAPIDDLQAYAARVAHVVWAEHCRAGQPARTRFLDQVRYFVENDESEDGVARWNDAAGVPVCGFARWRGKRATTKLEIAEAARVEITIAVARRRARSAVRQLLRAAGSPIALRELNDFLGRLLDDSLEQQRAGAVPNAPATSAAPHDEIFHRENLRWLWAELAALPRRQRVAFLLHAPVTKEFEYEGIASIREIAALLEMEAEKLAQVWFRIPLDDRTTAELLAATRQDVINLRKAARVTLGRRLAVFLEIDSPAGAADK